MKYQMKGYPNQMVEAMQVKANLKEMAAFLPSQFSIELHVKDGYRSLTILEENCWIIKDCLTGAFWYHTNDQFHAFYEELENV